MTLEYFHQIKRLCLDGQYDEAYEMAKQIDDKELAVRVYLFVFEREQSVLNSRG